MGCTEDSAGSADDSSEAPGSGREGLVAGEVEAVRALLVAVDRVWQALGARARMGLSEIVTLEALHFTSPLSTRQIRERTNLTPGAVTALLDRFEGRGLTRRIRPEHNRRTVLIELTPAGRKLSVELFAELLQLVEQGAHAPNLPDLAVRVQCLHYAATLLERAATLVSSAADP